MEQNSFKFKNINFVTTNSFTPNLTSELIYISAKEFIKKDYEVLDLGCGSGVVGLALLKQLQNFKLTSSDLSEGALKDTAFNAKEINLQINILHSDIFENITGKYDLIVNDISGISENVAKLSEWFLNAPCNSGIDGLNLFERVIEGSSRFLKSNGVMIFPLLSLSNTDRAIDIIDKYYTSKISLVKKEWFLPETIAKNNSEELQNLKESGHVYYQRKFGKLIVYTEVLCVKKIDSIIGDNFG